MLRQIVLAFIGVITPFLYTAITNADVDFPISGEDFAAMVVYIVFLPFGGAKIANAYKQWRASRKPY